jgi:hypothetical protein
MNRFSAAQSLPTWLEIIENNVPAERLDLGQAAQPCSA